MSDEFVTGDLHALWSLPLEEQHRLRRYAPFETARHYEPWAENAAPDLHRAGPFYIIPQTCKTVALVDGRKPWNACIESLHTSEVDARDAAKKLIAKEKRAP